MFKQAGGVDVVHDHTNRTNRTTHTDRTALTALPMPREPCARGALHAKAVARNETVMKNARPEADAWLGEFVERDGGFVGSVHLSEPAEEAGKYTADATTLPTVLRTAAQADRIPRFVSGPSPGSGRSPGSGPEHGRVPGPGLTSPTPPPVPRTS